MTVVIDRQVKARCPLLILMTASHRPGMGEWEGEF